MVSPCGHRLFLFWQNQTPYLWFQILPNYQSSNRTWVSFLSPLNHCGNCPEFLPDDLHTPDRPMEMFMFIKECKVFVYVGRVGSVPGSSSESGSPEPLCCPSGSSTSASSDSSLMVINGHCWFCRFCGTLLAADGSSSSLDLTHHGDDCFQVAFFGFPHALPGCHFAAAAQATESCSACSSWRSAWGFWRRSPARTLRIFCSISPTSASSSVSLSFWFWGLSDGAAGTVEGPMA